MKNWVLLRNILHGPTHHSSGLKYYVRCSVSGSMTINTTYLESLCKDTMLSLDHYEEKVTGVRYLLIFTAAVPWKRIFSVLGRLARSNSPLADLN